MAGYDDYRGLIVTRKLALVSGGMAGGDAISKACGEIMVPDSDHQAFAHAKRDLLIEQTQTDDDLRRASR